MFHTLPADRIAALAQQGFAYGFSELYGIFTLSRFPQYFRSIGTRHHCFQMQPAVDHFRQRSDRHLATAAHLVQQGPFAGGRHARRPVIKKGDVPAHAAIVLADLYRQRALARCWTHDPAGNTCRMHSVLPRR